MKRVLHLLGSNKFSGAENVACTIIENMSNKYDMAYCSPSGTIEETLKERKIKYYPVKELSYEEIKNVIDEYKPDIIHAHDFKATFIATRFYKKIRIISHIHKNDPKMKKISIKSLLYLYTLSKINKVIGVSESISKEYIFRKYLIGKYTTLYNYVDLNKIKMKSDAFKVNTHYDLFFLGRLSSEKNPLFFIEIVNKLGDKVKKCIIIGDGPMEEECLKLIDNYSLTDKIDIVGFQTNPFPYIKASKVGIMPSRYEGFGLAAIETSALNKVVLNSGVGGLEEIFKDNKELICKSINEYMEKAVYYINNKKNIDVFSKYSDKKKYINKLIEIYKDN